MIYLDHNATTPILPAVVEAVRDCQLKTPGNASSQHGIGRAARRVLEDAREKMVVLLGGSRNDRLVITSGGSESNNMALRGAFAAGAPSDGPPPHLLISAIEHPSIEQTAQLLASQGVAVERAPVDSRGLVRLEALVAMLRPETRLVSVMLANNETGVLQPVAEIAHACQEAGVPVHTDATQVVGKQQAGFRDLGVAAMTFSAHKFHGPQGVGGLLVHEDYQLPPLLAGQPGAERPGTPPVALAVGMLKALEAWSDERFERNERMTSLRNHFERGLLDQIPYAEVVGIDAPRLPHTSNVAMVGLDRQALAMALDRNGVACSTGSACASGSSEPSPALLAMGLPEEVVGGSLRFSLGALTTAAEVEEAVGRITRVCHHLKTAHKA